MGARLVVLPELWTYLGPAEGNRPNAEPIPGPVTELLSALARRFGLVLHGGSIFEVPAESLKDARPFNTALLFGPDGDWSRPTASCTCLMPRRTRRRSHTVNRRALRRETR